MSDRYRRWRPPLFSPVRALVLVALAVLLGGRSLLAQHASPPIADRWLLVATPILAYEVAFVRSRLDRLGLDGVGSLQALGLPNLLTMARGKLYAITAGFLLVVPTTDPIAWAPGLCYGIGVTIDYVDGALARRTGRTSELGARLDLAFDTLGFLVAPLVGVAWGRLPVFYLALSAARYLFLGGCWWRRRHGRPVYQLPQSQVRRPLAGLQMAFIAIALVPLIPASIVHPIAAVVMAPSLLVFGRDYLVVSGRLEPVGLRGEQ